jgi:hypothetical protein
LPFLLLRLPNTLVNSDISLVITVSDSLKELVLEEHYWRHVEYFPVHLQLSEDVESELRAILLHACAGKSAVNLHLRHRLKISRFHDL